MPASFTFHGLKCLEAFLQDHLEDEGLQMETFLDKHCEIANKAILESNPNPKKVQMPCFSEKRNQAILDGK